MTITEFLLARIAEDEKRAQDATPGPWESCAFDAGHSKFEMSVSVCSSANGDSVCDMDGLFRATSNERYTDDGAKDAWFIANNDPARVLAECAAKRGIIVTVDGWAHDFNDGDSWYSCGLAVDNFEFADNKTPGSGCSNEDNRGECQCGLERRQLLILAPMAAVYASHPDYQSAWLV